MSAITIPNMEPTKIKIKERCIFYPGCRLGESCEYMHPNTPCKGFPNCKFGDKCLFVHPMCKFDATCVRLDCNFTHTGTRLPQAAPPLGKKFIF